MTLRFRLSSFAAGAACLFLLSGCSEMELASHWAKNMAWPGAQESKGTYKIGKPYKVGDVWYYPEENFSLMETGIASWYGPGFHADRTANGETFDQSELTAAHRTMQLPALARVTNLENGRSVVVRVNDRGPFLHGRIMDVSMRAAELLGFADKGTARVRMEVLEKESRILADAAKRGEDTTRMTLAELRGKELMAAPVVEQPAVARTPVKTVSAASDADAVPESLQTPTITVESLNSSGTFSQEPLVAPAPVSSSPKLAEGKMKGGRFMPAPVVATAPVRPTAIFVQAGSFAIYSNAERLTKRLVSIAPALIEPVTIKNQKLYRVKLGPFTSVEKADVALAKVINAGMGTAKVVKAQ